MKRWGFSMIAGVSITFLLGVADTLAFRTGHYSLRNALGMILFWSLPIFSTFFDIVAPIKHSPVSYHPWGGYVALLLTVVIFSLISYAILWFASRAVKQ